MQWWLIYKLMQLMRCDEDNLVSGVVGCRILVVLDMHVIRGLNPQCRRSGVCEIDLVLEIEASLEVPGVQQSRWCAALRTQHLP
jgi:hypothetical protein